MIFAHVVTALLVPVINIFIAYLVVHSKDEVVWGEFVEYQIAATICLMLLNWGNKDYLLRAFAKRPELMRPLWQQVLMSRAAMLFMVLPALLLVFPMNSAVMLFSWIGLAFLQSSFDVLILYERKFWRTALAELSGTAVLVFGVWTNGPALDADAVLRWMVLSVGVKLGWYLLFYTRHWFAGPWPGMSFRFFPRALPFFLLGLAGMIQSRVDLWCVAWKMEDTDLARYQVYASMALYLQALAGLVLLPYARSIYRLQVKSVRRITLYMSLLGIPVALAAVPAVEWALESRFGFDLAPEMYYLLPAVILPVFLYSTMIYSLLGRGGENAILQANVGGILTNFGLNLLLIPRLGLIGVVMATAAGHFFVLVFVLLTMWKFRNVSQSDGRSPNLEP